MHKFSACMGSNCVAAIPQERPKLCDRLLGPIDLFSTRIGGRFRADFPHTVDAAQYFWLPELRRGTTNLVPTACVDDEQTAVGIHLHVCRMKIDEVGPHEVTVCRRKRAASWLQNV